MDFNQLMNKMREFDSQPTSEAGCSTDSMLTPVAAMPPKPDTPPPSMSVNLNAQGMDNIESMMKLFQRVNPDMMPKTPKPMPTLNIAPSIGSNKPEPMKMLPKLDAESYANEPEEHEMDIDQLIRNGNDLHKSKKTYPPVAGGDNPRQAIEDFNLDEGILLRGLTHVVAQMVSKKEYAAAHKNAVKGALNKAFGKRWMDNPLAEKIFDKHVKKARDANYHSISDKDARRTLVHHFQMINDDVKAAKNADIGANTDDSQNNNTTKEYVEKLTTKGNPRQAIEDFNLDEGGSEAREFIQQVKNDIESGASPVSLENEFFDTLEMMGWSTERIADQWDRIVNPPVSGNKLGHGSKDNIKDLLSKFDEPGEDDLDIPDVRGGVKIDRTGFGTGLESFESRRAAIREELAAQFKKFKI